MNPRLARLQPYPCEKVQRLFAGVTPPAGLPPISFRLTNRGMKLMRHYNAIVLPGSFLARENAGINPGANFPRVALVGGSMTVLKPQGASTHFANIFDRNHHA